MSYHSPIQSSSSNKKVLGGGSAARMAVMPSPPMASGMPKIENQVSLEKPAKPTTTMDELGLATGAEKNKKGYLSTYLEGQTPYNKLSSFLGSRKL